MVDDFLCDSITIFVGVLEPDFIQPTHNKQDFEKTSLFQKLEDRLKQMTVEYWWATSYMLYF